MYILQVDIVLTFLTAVPMGPEDELSYDITAIRCVCVFAYERCVFVLCVWSIII